MISLLLQTLPFSLNAAIAWVYFAVAQTPVSPSTINQDPLISQKGENLIYVGLALMLITLSLILGKIFEKLEVAILFALTLAAVLILFIWFI